MRPPRGEVGKQLFRSVTARRHFGVIVFQRRPGGMRNSARIALAVVVLLVGALLVPRPAGRLLAPDAGAQVPTPTIPDILPTDEPSPSPSDTGGGGGGNDGGGGSGGGDDGGQSGGGGGGKNEPQEPRGGGE